MSKDTKVLYNAECPVCNFEISHYATYAQKKNLPIQFDDLNTDAREAWDIDADTAARRLYVEKDGIRYGGIEAFIVLWRDMPRYRWVAWLAGLPVIRHIAIFGYDYALAPAIYRWHLFRQKRKKRNLGRTQA